MHSFTAKFASTGKNSAVVATLDNTSVAAATMMDMQRAMLALGRCCRPSSRSPSHALRPEVSAPAAKANPEPKRNITFHGSLCCTVSQSNSRGDLPAPIQFEQQQGSEGITKSSNTMSRAVVASLTKLLLFSSFVNMLLHPEKKLGLP